MNLDTFKANVDKHWRLEVLRGALFMMLMGAAALPTVFVVRRLDHAGFDAPAIGVVSVSYMIIAAFMFYNMSPIRQKQLRQLHAECPTCDRLLLGKHSGSVIATGRCPVCGSQVLQ